jgi:hypothetical protein
MNMEITSIIGEGWSGIIYDNGNKIVFGAYLNKKGNLVLPTFYYHSKKHNNSNVPLIKEFILKNMPELSGEYFAKSFTETSIYKQLYNCN